MARSGASTSRFGRIGFVRLSCLLAGWPMTSQFPSYDGYRFPPDIIRRAISYGAETRPRIIPTLRVSCTQHHAVVRFCHLVAHELARKTPANR